MCQNPSNALIGLGHAGGVLTFWSPNQREPVVKMLAHKSTLRSMTIDRNGTYGQCFTKIIFFLINYTSFLVIWLQVV